jgi:hypothetical protein
LVDPHRQRGHHLKASAGDVRKLDHTRQDGLSAGSKHFPEIVQ